MPATGECLKKKNVSKDGINGVVDKPGVSWDRLKWGKRGMQYNYGQEMARNQGSLNKMTNSY